MHTSPLIKLHKGLIILGLGNSRKSAPFIPKVSETMPREKIKNIASVKPITIACGEGYVKTTATTKQTKVMTKLKIDAKKYFAFTRLLAEIGDE